MFSDTIVTLLTVLFELHWPLILCRTAAHGLEGYCKPLTAVLKHLLNYG